MPPFKNTFPLILAALSAIWFGSPLAHATSLSPVNVKCEIRYTDFSGGSEHQDLLRSLKLDTESVRGGMNYKFDHVETLKIAGKPDLKIWIKGNYFHNQNEVNSYLRLTTTVCENKLGTKDVKCFGSDYSGDVFANVVQADTIYHGKKLQMVQTAVTAIDFSKSLEVQANYRLKTGRSLIDDLDLKDPAQIKKYQSLVTPLVGVTCSVRDDAFGVESAF